jgi:hypothetical protein
MHPNRKRGQEATCWNRYKEMGVTDEQRERIAELGRQRRSTRPADGA